MPCAALMFDVSLAAGVLIAACCCADYKLSIIMLKCCVQSGKDTWSMDKSTMRPSDVKH